MKRILFNTFLAALAVYFLISLESNILSSQSGITGMTRKNGAVGCICHGFHEPDTTVRVLITGIDSVAVGQTVYPKLKIIGGPHVRGGLDVAVGHGTLDTTYLDPGVRKQTQYYGPNPGDTAYEITHVFPKEFTGDTLTFTFKYIAPNTAGFDTLFANGNSVNFNGEADTIDAWNFSADKIVRIYVPIGIENISTVASDFSLSQNYPNPFNPTTNILFSVSKQSHVTLSIYDASGRLVQVLADGMYNTGKYKAVFDGSLAASGVYFYRLTAGDFTQTKKLVLIK
jgi:hypothetical protein